MPTKRLSPEHYDQIRLSTWLKNRGIKHHANANGAKRTTMAGKKLVAMGMSKGFPDIEIPYRSGSYGCLYIEMKKEEGGKLSPEQIEWLEFLRSQGHYADYAEGFEEAKEIVLHYLSLTKPAA
jgi:VRR-NUC domain